MINSQYSNFIDINSVCNNRYTYYPLMIEGLYLSIIKGMIMLCCVIHHGSELSMYYTMQTCQYEEIYKDKYHFHYYYVNTYDVTNKL